jgi:sec-independent protein translocase protein TatC
MAKSNQGNMSFLQHLEVLRWHLVRSAVAIVFMAIICFLAKELLFDVIIFGPKNIDFITYRAFCQITTALGTTKLFCLDKMPFEILNTKMAGQFSTHIWVSLIAGFILAFPYVLFEVWRFIKPGLKPKEQNYSRWVLFFGGILFTIGVAFGYFLIVPLSVQFLGGYSISAEITNLIDLVSYISTVSTVTLATGLIFELPVVVYFLARSGLLTPAYMRTYRRHAIVLILVLSAIITPPDIASQVLVSLPIFILYEISIIICMRVVANQEKTAKALANS